MVSNPENKIVIKNLSNQELVTYVQQLTIANNFNKIIDSLSDKELLRFLDSFDCLDYDDFSHIDEEVLCKMISNIENSWHVASNRNLSLAMGRISHSENNYELARRAYETGERRFSPQVLAEELKCKLKLALTQREKSIFDLTFTGSSDINKHLVKYIQYIYELCDNDNIDALRVMAVYLQHNTSHFFASRQYIRKILEMGKSISCSAISNYESKDLVSCQHILLELIDVYCVVENKIKTGQLKRYTYDSLLGKNKIYFNSHHDILIDTIKTILKVHDEKAIIILNSITDNIYIASVISFLVASFHKKNNDGSSTAIVKDDYQRYKSVLGAIKQNYQPAIDYMAQAHPDSELRKLFITDLQKL